MNYGTRSEYFKNVCPQETLLFLNYNQLKMDFICKGLKRMSGLHHFLLFRTEDKRTQLLFCLVYRPCSYYYASHYAIHVDELESICI